MWVATIANVRLHGQTHQRPVDLFKEEQSRLQPLNPMPYDVGSIKSQRASKQFRVLWTPITIRCQPSMRVSH